MGQKEKCLTDYVDPNIGAAHCRWFFYTPAALPFGMAKVAPSTDGHLGNPGGWEAVGYDCRHSSIEGFANFHEFQIGGVVLAPTTGKLQTIPGDLDNPDGGYRSRFDKKDEYASAGYYSVMLKDYGIKAELTATPRVGFHKYTYPESSESHLIFDIGNKQGESGEVKDAKVTITNDGHIEGYVVTEPIYVKSYQKGSSIAMYFSAVLNKTPERWGAFRSSNIIPNVREISGRGSGIYLTFATKAQETVTVKVGLSYTSIANARLNLETEAQKLSFDEAKKIALKTWNNYLGRIKIEGKNEQDKVKFYTGLYHALLGRGLASDVNGAYPMNNGGVGQIETGTDGKPKYNHYNTDAMWGAFWNLTQLWTIAYPEYYSDFIQSQLLVYKDTGWLGDGIACSKFVSGVGTNFIGLIIASAYNCGIRNFNVDLGYQAALKNELSWKDRPEGAGKLDVHHFIEEGYCPFVDHNKLGLKKRTSTIGSNFSASHTLEYSFSAYAVAQFAKALGKQDDYEQLMKLSKGWKLLYNPENKFICPRDSNGAFLSDFDPYKPWRGFQEGNAWQYTFYVPHDIEELIQMMGKETFNSRLDSIFTASQKSIFGGGSDIDAFAGLSAVYNQGNEPDLQMSWLFNYSGKPYLTQKWVRAICNDFYGTECIHGYGYGQDEDQGQLGAWYVMSSMGLFDVKGLTEENPEIQIGSPLFDKITIRLNPDYYKGKKFIIRTANNSTQNIYIQSVSLNGKLYNNPWINHSDIVSGGKLVFQMGSRPNKDWGRSPDVAPPSMSAPSQ